MEFWIPSPLIAQAQISPLGFLNAYAQHPNQTLLRKGGFKSGAHHRFMDPIYVSMWKGDADIDDVEQTAPPRHGKTLHGTQATTVWGNGIYPGEKYLICGYSSTFVQKELGRVIKTMIEEVGWEFYGIKVDPDRCTQDTIGLIHCINGKEVKYSGGGIYLRGRGEGQIGIGFKRKILDDLYANNQEAKSPVIRKKVLDWVFSDVLTRREPGETLLKNMTRWDSDDLHAQLENFYKSQGEENYFTKRYNFTMIAGEDDILGRKPGEYLWPEALSAKDYQKIIRETPAAIFETQFQGNPTSQEGKLYKTEWFTNTYHPADPWGEIVNGNRQYTGDGYQSEIIGKCWSVDSADSDTTGNAESAATLWGWTAAGKMFPLYAFHGHWLFPELLANCARDFKAHPANYIIIEKKSTGNALGMALKELGFHNVVMVDPSQMDTGASDKSKVGRCSAASVSWANGDIVVPYVPEGARASLYPHLSWWFALKEQLLRLDHTAKGKWDLADTAHQGILWIRAKVAKRNSMTTGGPSIVPLHPTPPVPFSPSSLIKRSLQANRDLPVVNSRYLRH